jgi:hypothetical protein
MAADQMGHRTEITNLGNINNLVSTERLAHCFTDAERR